MQTSSQAGNEENAGDAEDASRQCRVVALVNNPCVVDARVLREATALAEAGYQVDVLAHAAPELPSEQFKEGVRYHRRRVRASQVSSDGTHTTNSPRNLAARAKGMIEKQPTVVQSSAQSLVSFARKGTKLVLFVPREVLKLVRYAVTGTGVELVRHARAYYSPAIAMTPDVVHAHDLYTMLAGYLIARKTGARLVYDSHELEVGRNGNFSRWELWLRARAERFLIKKADAVITVCDSIADYLATLYKIERPAVIHNAPNTGAVNNGSPDVRSQLNLPQNTPIALYVGRVTIDRGLEHCVRALPHAAGVHMVCVGHRHKPTEEAILEEAKGLGVGDRVHLVEPVPHDQVTSFVRTADVSLITIQDVCLSYRFCFPNKLLESLFTGLPIVVSKLVELERLVELTGAGVVVDQTDPKDIARGINDILAARDKYVPTPEIIRQLKGTYSLEVQMGKLVALFDRLLPQRSIR